MRPLFALFIRSVREDTRSRLPIILRTALILIILLIVWANHRDFSRRPAPGREFLLMVVMVNLAFITVAALGTFASAITEEKEDDTLPLLRMTNLNPLAILFGKSTTRLLGAALLLAVQIPFTTLAITLGGVNLTQVLGAYAILGATTFFLCNLALLGSVICRTTLRAGIFTFVTGGTVFALFPIAAILTSLRQMRPGALVPQNTLESFFTWVMEANPVYALAMLIERQSSAAIVRTQTWSSLGAGAFCFLLAWLLFSRFCTTSAETASRRRRWKFTSLLRGIGGRRRPSLHRALAWKDFHFLIGGWRGMLIRVVLCALVFLACYGVESFESPPQRRTWFWRSIGEEIMVFSAMGFGLELALLASRIFGVERRMLTLSGLAGLPRATGWLIRQKVLGCLPALLPSTALFCVGYLIYEGWHRTHGGHGWNLDEDEVIVTTYVISQGLLLAVLTATFSLRIRRGALPAGIAVITIWNILVAVMVDSAPRRSEVKLLLALAIGCLIATAILAAFIPRHLRAAAAEG
ncbi:MAG: hypothetical protein ABMA01_07180 [Chthoniobacteraceae bacterium]